MSHLLTSRTKQRLFGFATVIVLLACILAVAPVFGEVTSDDIAALQERGKKEGWTFTVGVTDATGRTIDQLCGFDPTLAPADGPAPDPVSKVTRALPDRFDWRDSCILPIAKDQGNCGSCWAFATTGVLECQIATKDDNYEVDLSEQWILDCNPWGYGCNGGFNALNMFISTSDPCGGDGAVLEEDEEYTQVEGTCNCPYEHHYWLESWGNISATVAQIQQAIIDYGPVYVSVRANETTWPSYNGGVYDLHESGPTNHAVVLVGWDDNQGTGGVWFLRNSWGSWGETNGYPNGNGYMRIEYGCCSVGSNPTRVYYQPIVLDVNTALGQQPLTVNFEAVAPRDSVEDADWGFGDGEYGAGATISHTYTQTGVFDVQAIVETPHGTMNRTFENFIAVHSDTMIMAQEVGDAGQPVKVDVYARNFLNIKEIRIPVQFEGPLGIVYDSFSTAGLRTDYFEQKTQEHFDYWNDKVTFYLNCSNTGSQPYLAPGSGAVLSIWFTIPAGASGINPIIVEEYTSGSSVFSPSFYCDAGNYEPTINSGSVSCGLTCCTGPSVGNVDASPDNMVTMGDLTVLIDHLFISLMPIACVDEGNVDMSPDGLVTMGDLTVLIDALFISLDPLPPCP